MVVERGGITNWHHAWNVTSEHRECRRYSRTVFHIAKAEPRLSAAKRRFGGGFGVPLHLRVSADGWAGYLLIRAIGFLI